MTVDRPIVIVGLPRSGTTWTLRALGSAAGVVSISEADNEDKQPTAISAKHQVGRYPVLRLGQESPAYRRLWAWIFNGAPEGRRSLIARRILGPGAVERIHDGRFDPVTRLAGAVAGGPPPTTGPTIGAASRVVAKSIHAQLSIEWLADAFDVEVALILRHPANVLASWSEVNLKDARNTTLENDAEIRSRYLEPWGVAPPGPDPIERMSWRIGLLTAVLEDVSSRHPDWPLLIHEQLCADPPGEFRRLYNDLGLPWGRATENFLDTHNAPGSGFVVKRVASELKDSWQRRLDNDQVATLRRVMSWFPITTWSDQDFRRRHDRDGS
jgi:hypothetical protein